MRPSSLASCMRRMRFLAAITAGVLQGPLPPQAEAAHETQPWLALPCLRLWLGPSDSDLAWSRSCSSRIWGKVDVSLPAVGWSIDAAKPAAAQVLGID